MPVLMLWTHGNSFNFFFPNFSIYMIYLNLSMVLSFEEVQVVPYDLVGTILAFCLLSVACYQKRLVIPGPFTVLMLQRSSPIIVSLHVNCLTSGIQETVIKNTSKWHRNLRFVTFGFLVRKA